MNILKFLFNIPGFCDTIKCMKNKISFLAAIIAAFGINTVNASECIDDDCDLYEIIEDSEFLDPQEIHESIWIESENATCEINYACPFDSESECEIWYKKPVYNQAVAPRAPHLNTVRTDDILYAIENYEDFNANEPVAEPLLMRYKMLMRASKSCCTEGIIYKLQEKKSSEKQIYQFLKDDANIFGIGTRCLVTTNDNILKKYSNNVDNKMVTDVRNSCLCKNRIWFESLLEPFKDIYKEAPNFESQPFNYTYIDSLNRQITVSINEDVQNVVNLLEYCPD